MRLTLRDYTPSDRNQIAQVLRDSHNTLRKSRGGTHPDSEMDRFLSLDDARLTAFLLRDSKVLVAMDDDAKEIAGVGAFSDRTIGRILGSAYVKGLYVREKYQHGRCGVKVGTRLRDERIRCIRERGYRKIYAFSVPESRRFHEKAGAKFFPSHDFYYMWGKVRLNYYEIILRESPLNAVRIEPYLFKAGMMLSYAADMLRRLLRFPRPEL